MCTALTALAVYCIYSRAIKHPEPESPLAGLNSIYLALWIGCTVSVFLGLLALRKKERGTPIAVITVALNCVPAFPLWIMAIGLISEFSHLG
jgi:hypothetical protein